MQEIRKAQKAKETIYMDDMPVVTVPVRIDMRTTATNIAKQLLAES